MNVLQMEGVGKRYGAAWALRGCDLALAAGRVVALVGPNGAGKTTLLRLVTGLVDPTEGVVSVFGASAVTDTRETLARVGFVAQDHPLYRRFTVAEHLRMGRALNVRWDQQLAERRLAAVGVRLKQRAGTLSGGQQAQVALTLALAKRPELLVLDEPVAGLDPLARREFMQTLLTAVAEDGLTVLLSSHVVAELERACDYLVLLTAGRVQLAGDIDELLHAHRMLTGPRPNAPVGARMPGAIAPGTDDASVIVRTDAAPIIGWQQSHPVDLEQLVLAYLQRAARRPSVDEVAA